MAAAGTSRFGRLCVVLCWLLTVTSAVEQLNTGTVPTTFKLMNL